jgi:hypothetical protein
MKEKEGRKCNGSKNCQLFLLINKCLENAITFIAQEPLEQKKSETVTVCQNVEMYQRLSKQ